ncbi:MAG TPA: YihY/virulence factor BrkB family protein [Rubrobacteraceae bacterium]|nr:YihY/virulence factor BrkB family protein [Rubrobacteraceae bacterium]
MRTSIVEVGERSGRNFFRHRMTTYAAALAYRGLFGLFPFLLIFVVLTSMLGFPGYFDRIMDQARSETTPQLPRRLEPMVEDSRQQVEPLETMFEQAQEQAGSELLFFGIAVGLWSVSALARTLADALNAAYEVTETRPGWKRVGLSVSFGPVLALMATISVGLMLIGTQLMERLAEIIGLADLFVLLWGLLRIPTALLLLAVVLSVVYRYGPDVSQRFRHVVPGAALAVVLWAISSIGFAIYLANFADYGATYGSLGAAVGLLFYLYLSASVVLIGAEVNAAIYRVAQDKRTPPAR